MESNTTKIGNIHSENSFFLACIGCGIKQDTHLTAHRNKEGHIVGFIVGCNKCIKGEQELFVKLISP